jgi:molecular chaperone DnaK
MVYQVEKMLKENGDKISGDEKGQVESAVADAKKALEGTDAAAMNAAREKLTAASHKLAEVMYKAQQTPPQDAAGAGPQAGAPQNGAAGQQEKKDEGVIDAEYVDVEDKR